MIHAAITDAVTKEASCTADGVRTYTATVTFEGKTYTDQKTEVIPADGHLYGEPKWTWTGYTAAKATFTCDKNDDTQTVNAAVTSAVTTEPSLTEDGVRTYTATVVFGGKTYTDQKTESIPKLYLIGDSDDDGVVSIIDATMIQRILAGLPVSSFNENAADVDRNGLTILDATMIQRFLVGLQNGLHIGEPNS